VPGAGLRIEPDREDPWTFADNVVLEGFYSGPGWVEASAGAEGEADFARLDPERGYVLWIEPPAARVDLAPRYLPAWRPRANEELRLLRWATLRGVVLDEAGSPVPGAWVVGFQPGDGETGTWAEADAGGRFTIPHRRPGPVALTVLLDQEAAPDMESPAYLHTDTSAGEVVLVVER
jgi:hypothetical protein